MRRTKLATVLVGLVSVVVGLALLWISTYIATPWSLLCATLATVIMTIGVVNLVSDWFLRRSVTDDLISLIQTDRRLIESGVDRFERLQDVDWVEIFTADDHVEIMILDTEPFKALIWPRLLDAAKAGLRSASLVVVDVSDDQTLRAYAGRHQEIEADARASVTSFESKIELEWKAMKSASTSPCTLTLRRTRMVPTYSYAESSRVAVIILEPLSPETGLVDSRALTLRTERRGTRYAKWFTESTKAVRDRFSAPSYTDNNTENVAGEL